MPSQPPFRLQLAIQGGGAKICVLLAAMEAVQSLESEGLIKVTRVAGTSAGAIVACLFAAGIEMPKVKQRLSEYTPEQLAKYFPKPSITKAIYKLGVKGKPLWESNFLRSELGKFFADAGVETLRQLNEKRGVKTLIIASDLTESGMLVYPEKKKGADGEHEEGDEMNVVDALLDSCGLPYCFRIWDKQSRFGSGMWKKNRNGNGDRKRVIVDGGICENLPSDVLLRTDNRREDGPVVGISFEPTDRNTPGSAFDFTVALLDTAINNSMTRAKLSLGTELVHSIPTKLSTFDFRKALKVLQQRPDEDNRTYDWFKGEAETWFRRLAAAEKGDQVVVKDSWRELSVSMMGKLRDIYHTQHLTSKLKYRLSSLAVQANCLVTDPDNLFYNEPDSIDYHLKFETLDEPIYCHAFALSETSDDTAPSQTAFSLLDVTNDAVVETISVPMRDPGKPDGKELLLFFIPPLPRRSGPYILKCQDVARGFMKKLKTKLETETGAETASEAAADDLYITSLRAQGTIDRIDLVLFVPNTVGEMNLAAMAGSAPGRMMTNVERSAYKSPPGFRALCWTGENVPPDSTFGVDFFLKPETK